MRHYVHTDMLERKAHAGVASAWDDRLKGDLCCRPRKPRRWCRCPGARNQLRLRNRAPDRHSRSRCSTPLANSVADTECGQRENDAWAASNADQTRISMHGLAFISEGSPASRSPIRAGTLPPASHESV